METPGEACCGALLSPETLVRGRLALRNIHLLIMNTRTFQDNFSFTKRPLSKVKFFAYLVILLQLRLKNVALPPPPSSCVNTSTRYPSRNQRCRTAIWISIPRIRSILTTPLGGQKAPIPFPKSNTRPTVLTTMSLPRQTRNTPRNRLKS